MAKEKLQAFDEQHTRWEGLWYHPEDHNYTSATLNLSTLKGFKGTCRLRMFKNRKSGKNQPTYLFTISSTTEDKTEEVKPIEVGRELTRDDLIAELRDVMQQGELNGYVMALPSESYATAQRLYERAIQIIEELTGTEWNFNYMNFG